MSVERTKEMTRKYEKDETPNKKKSFSNDTQDFSVNRSNKKINLKTGI